MANQLWLMTEPAEDIDAARLIHWLARRPREGLVVEYKRGLSRSTVRSVAAMANTHGGVLLLGIDDAADGRESAVGVSAEAELDFVNQCFDRLDPPYVPDIVTVPLEGGRVVLVVRVTSEAVRRPALCDGRVPIRLQGRNATADAQRIRTLALESNTSTVSGPAPGGLEPRTFFPPADDPEIVFRVAGSVPLQRSLPAPLIGASRQQALAQVVERAPVDSWLPDLSENVGMSAPGSWQRGGNTRSDVLELVRQTPGEPGRAPVAGVRVIYSVSRSPITGGGLVAITDFLLWPSRVPGSAGLSVSLRDLGNMAQSGAQTLIDLVASDVTRQLLPATALYAPSGPAGFAAGDLARVDLTLGLVQRESRAPQLSSQHLHLDPPSRWPVNAAQAREWIIHGLQRRLLDDGFAVDREDVAHYLGW